MTTDPMHSPEDARDADAEDPARVLAEELVLGVGACALGPPRPTVLWHALTGAWALLAATMAAGFGGIYLALIVLAFGGLLGLIWCFALLRVVLSREARGRLTWRAAAHWAVCPATGLVFTALAFTPWPFVLRMKLSEAALLRLVEDVEAGRASFDRPVRAGLFVIDRARILRGCVLLEANEGWPLATQGIAYVRDDRRWLDVGWGEPPPFTHRISGSWWWFYYPD